MGDQTGILAYFTGIDNSGGIVVKGASLVLVELHQVTLLQASLFLSLLPRDADATHET